MKRLKKWCGQEWLDELEHFEIISWHKLERWREDNLRKIKITETASQWAIAFDEVAKAKAGWSSHMGRAFIVLTITINTWAGYTATPGDEWADFGIYMVAAGLYKNKSCFMERLCDCRYTYDGWRQVKRLLPDYSEVRKEWDSISVRPDASELTRQLPEETHEYVYFNAPHDYSVEMNHLRGKFIARQNIWSVCHELRQLCFSESKKTWLRDFIEGLGTNGIFFCNYTKEEDELYEIARSVLPESARIWRLDGRHREIPTKQMMGERDIIIAHYLSGGEALNLEFVNYWCAVSPNYSFSISEQSRGRIKRFGQKMPMFFYYLWSKDTIEDDIYACLKRKQKFSEEVWAAENGLLIDDFKE